MEQLKLNVVRPQKKKPKRVPLSRPSVTPVKGKELHELMSNLQLSQPEGSAPLSVSFEDMGLSPKILKGIYGVGLEKPAKIQERAIVPMIKGRDVIMQAQSGMGKTAALVIASLSRVDLSNKECQVLVITPTRELAEQVTKVYKDIGKPLGVTVYSCVGGTNTKACIKNVQSGKQVIVGTSGRVSHMLFKESYIRSDFIKLFAMDEADKMLTNEFQHDITNVLERIPPNSQIVLMSATMPEHILRKTPLFMRNPLKFLLRNDELTLDGIRQFYLNVDREEEKINVLCDIYESIKRAQGMIFCRTRARVDQLAKLMKGRNHIVSATRGDLTQAERDKVLEDFRFGRGESRMLITSDLLARGIDVQQVSLVINYDIPEPKRKEEYIHRVGRGGRYGRHGVAITFVTSNEVKEIEGIERFYNTNIPPLPDLKSFIPTLNIQ